MKINDRLKKIGDLVDANSFCLDIGCDHAFLDIYLVKKNKNIKAIASDIAEGPVKQAKDNIKREGILILMKLILLLFLVWAEEI